MSEDRQSTESLPPSAEPSDVVANSASPTGRAKNRQTTLSTKAAQTEKPEDAPPVNAVHSVPMTASNSSSSEVGLVPDSLAAPYSTRSRGRNGAPRPNYAEDIEMDFELTSPAPTTAKAPTTAAKRNATSSVNSSPAATESEKGPAASTRKGQAAANGVHANSAVKDMIPGTSTFSANTANGATSAPSRKRKQPPTGSTGANANGTTKRSLNSASENKMNFRLSNMMTFENSGARLKNGKLKADDGTTLEVNDHVYLVCEPPGEPYYLGRIMEFLPAKGNSSGPVEMVRVNWYYRPKDIQRSVSDPRFVFASMHSDPCPLSSLRGKCSIMHVSEISNLDEYRRSKDTFWYDKMFDRYMHRYYEVVPTKDVINVPEHVKKVLDDRWKFILCELARKKELTGAVKTCIKCGLYAASAESVDCAVCHHTYHMNCVRPKLTKKPARGFAWACALCSRAQERKLEARNTPMAGENLPDIEEDLPEEDDDEPMIDAVATGRSSPAADEKKKPEPATAAQIAQAKMWPYRYFGIHCQLEDALDYDDRIYPRASSRIGTRHQAIVSPWFGQPVQYAKPLDLKKRFKGSGKVNANKLSKETQAAIEAEKQDRLARPWVMDEPQGYVRRGEDEPVPVNGKEVHFFRSGEDDAPGSEMSQEERENFIDEYMARAKEVASERGLPKYHTNFLDKALEYLYSESYNVDAALKRLKKADLYKDLKEPKLNKDQKALFEEGVSKYGSEWINIRRHIGNIETKHVVRYYYMWKKTTEGRRIWGSYEGRRGKKEARRADPSSKLLDDIADEHDDSAFDNDKATEKKKGFQCKFCLTRSSPQWRRAPLTTPGATIPAEPTSKKADRGSQLAVALCHRCAIMWRKYAIEYKDVDELAKRLQAGGNKAWRRKLDEEMLAQMLVSDESPLNISSTTAATAASIGVNVNGSITPDTQSEPVKKKARTLAEKDSATTSARNSVEPLPKKKPIEKPAEPLPIIPEPPRAKVLPCAICKSMDSTSDAFVSCRDCRLTVHQRCYGVAPDIYPQKWLCDACSNDRTPLVSTIYECVLCPVAVTEQELMEAPKSNHKKKTERDREKERLEKELVAEAIKLYQRRQEAVGKPTGPREPLKRTVGNNWVHVNCALWNPEIKFGNAVELEPAEGFGLIPRDRYQEICKLCKTKNGSCVSCHYPGCSAKFHVGCAFQADYLFGFDVNPVKGSRRESITTMKIGEETGSVTPGIWCPSHAAQADVHDISEPTDHDGLNALALYVRTYKQADLGLTGTVRKAAHVQQHVNAPLSSNGSVHVNRRASGAGSTQDNTQGPSSTSTPVESAHPPAGPQGSKACVHCKTSFSPRWWLVDNPHRSNITANGLGHLTNGTVLHSRTLSQGSVPYVNGDYRTESELMFECHKCHLKRPIPPPSTESHPSPYDASRASVLPTSRPADYTPQYTSHGHPPQQGPLGRPEPPAQIPPLPPSGSAWYNGYEHLPKHGVPTSAPQTNGFGQPPPYPPSGPPHLPSFPGPAGTSVPPHAHTHHSPPPAAAHLPPPPPGPYPGVLPVPSPAHPYSTPSYASPALSTPHGPPSLPFGTSMSPPDIRTSLVHRSPPRALGGHPPPPSRVYPVEMVGHSPSMSRGSVDHSLPSTPNRSEEHAITSTHPTNSARYPSGSSSGGPSANTGASASPSLKNLLS
ncbi:hypothetical protein BGW36DRAFT_395670 [Talaromyces proteolyticus]|uniref:PHD finger and BAH domain protein n=1 Tax=Talaromyces proteolyticus TaxID=1131652 RepID=A0AAD4Q2P3_9EURO|nr:uncharacterized protein BGW36DRAFT_395670 [Talaromyces proteolyticus]KAH8700612.1 hypothetical protein BGW36DRAFT_395670 [Talaromyces proteolyticus]